MNRPLFQAFPALEKSVPVLEFAALPTPVQALHALAPNLWIKRDDQTHAIYGGNKVRKLEFILADVLATGKKHLVTFGAIGTNHGVASTIFCQQQGIECTVLLFDQPVTPTVQQNLMLMHHFGAHLRHQGSLLKTVLGFYFQKYFQPRNDYFLFAGGSDIRGCIGFVNAALELKQQIDAGALPEPDLIYCPVGSASTVAGLTLGCSLAGLSTIVVGVRVAPSHLGILPTCTQKTIHKLMTSTYNHLRSLDASLADHRLPVIHLNEDFYGKGYGYPSLAGQEATRLCEKAGIKLDPTYTAKAAAAAISCCKNHPDTKILYWHTFNSADMSQSLVKIDKTTVPKDLLKIPIRQVPR